MNEKLNCVWSSHIKCSGKVKRRSLFMNQLIAPICWTHFYMAKFQESKWSRYLNGI